MYRLAGNLKRSLAVAVHVGHRQAQTGQRDVNMRFDNPSHPQAGTIGESLPVYALPPDVECQRKEAPRHVSSQAETGPSGSVSYLSIETGVDHRRGSQTLRVLTFIPPEFWTAGILLANEQGGMGSRGTPIAHAIVIDGVSVAFDGYDSPGLVVLMARRADHAIGIVSRNWPLSEVSLVRVADPSLYEVF